MKDLWRFIKSSGIYFVGTVLTKLISFLLLPLYTSYISLLTMERMICIMLILCFMLCVIFGYMVRYNAVYV